MATTPVKLIRWAGLSAMGAGILFMAMQVIHPPDVLASVTTDRWTVVHCMGVVMGLLGLLGISGIYARQVEAAGWLGLIGYLLFSLFFAITMVFQFIEAFVSPVLATEAPRFVEGLLGIASGHATGMNLGALPAINALTGFLGYVLGGLAFGVATLRARILPRWTGGLLAIAAVSVLAAPVLGHPLDRVLAVPMGLALVCLGLVLLTERREQAAEPFAGQAR
jgi:hypothetical protein